MTVTAADADRADRPRRPVARPLAGLLAGGSDDDPLGVPAVTIDGITADSRLVVPGDLYVAVPGKVTHGVEFAHQAVGAGAVAVLTDADGALRLADRDLGVPVLSTADPRSRIAGLAAELYGHPAERLTMLGLTGTNGKTTTSFLLEAALRAAGRHPGLIGTLGYRYDGAGLDVPALRTTVTTPEAAEVQALLATLVERGADSCVMEVSSHALVLGRVDAVRFDVAAFTNLGADHLDFHGSQEDYFAAKSVLFEADRSRAAVINLDDAYGARLAEALQRRDARWVGTSLRAEAEAAYRPLRASRRDDGRTAVVAATPGGEVEFELGLPGAFNLHNAVTALAVLDLAGVDLAVAATGLAEATVPGRMQRVELGPDAPTAFVDFAHTPQAVGAVLAALRAATAPDGRLIAVLGCGGDRDPAKRGPMGETAARGSDVVVATDDNPRSEDPTAIRQALLSGARSAVRSDGLATEVLDGGDRGAAIPTALQRARPGDVVAVLGKGHEQGQEIGGRTLPFDDVAVLRQAWADVTGGVSGS